MNNKLAIIVPCYNEEEILPFSSSKLKNLLEELINKKKVDKDSQVVFIDDGSNDKTWKIIEKLTEDSIFQGIKLSRNYGHQNALLSGLFNVNADIYVTIDADLQDDINVIREMINKYHEGKEIVYGVRKKRESDSFFKRFTAEGFYKLMNFFGVDLVYNHADFRLMSKRAVESLKDFQEVNLFLRGIVPLIGFSSEKVYYDRTTRVAGESKYPLRKMLSFAWQGITSFSTVPLKLISLVGFIVFIVSIFMGGWVLWQKFFTSNAIPGWASTVLPIYFIGGMQLLSLGIIGEYIGKIYSETKRRPRYFIDKIIPNQNNTKTF